MGMEYYTTHILLANDTLLADFEFLWGFFQCMLLVQVW
jgi:hypothetical protein